MGFKPKTHEVFCSMSTFEQFAQAHGLNISRGLILGQWVAVPTEDKPQKRNGRYKFMGSYGWVQNWATMESPALWSSESPSCAVSQKAIEIAKQADAESVARAFKAAKKAGWILHQAKPDIHEYLKRKGFHGEVGMVWHPVDSPAFLVVPMRMDGHLIGCQLIQGDGTKKFLFGQRSKGAAYVIDGKGVPIFCEGYATGLSIRAAMKAMKHRYTVYVCFSAGNMREVASKLNGGLVVADNDEMGIKTAESIGKPYWLSPVEGEDFNDFYQRTGLFSAMQSLKECLLSNTIFPSGERKILEFAERVPESHR